MLQKILAAIDDSAINKLVFEAALSLAKTTGGHLRGLHVVPPDEETAQDQPVYLTDIKHYSCERENQVTYEERLFGAYVNAAIDAGIRTEFFQYLGDPGQIICNFALIWEADVIVLGRQARPNLKLTLGSVSSHVLQYAPCSVHIVYPQFHTSIETLLNEKMNR